MMLTVIGSGSSGNCYLLTSNSGKTLILEAGIQISEVFKHVGYDDIEGVLISHKHGDHAGKINSYLAKSVDVYVSKETMDELKLNSKYKSVLNYKEKEILKVGGFDIIPFRLQHDVCCHGFMIRHKEMKGNLLFCTDTASIPYTFDDVQTLMIEADFDEEIMKNNLKSGSIKSFLAKRIRNTHFSIRKAIKFCRGRDLSKLRKIILIHLSQNNADAEDFKKRMIANTGKPVYVATKGLVINIDDNPFI